MVELIEILLEIFEIIEVICVVEVFFNVLQNEDFDIVDVVLGDDLVYENVGFFRICGGCCMVMLFCCMQGCVGFEVKIYCIGVDGVVVFIECIDVLIIGLLWVQFWVCGVFEVDDGWIILWWDYFDVYDMFKGFL